jgi:hypothetical protein
MEMTQPEQMCHVGSVGANVSNPKVVAGLEDLPPFCIDMIIEEASQCCPRKLIRAIRCWLLY